MSILSTDLHWAKPVFLLLLLAIPCAVYFYLWFRRNQPGVVFSAFRFAARANQYLTQMIRTSIGWLRALVLILLVLVLVRPQSETRQVERRIEARDILLVLDLSESMLAADMRPTRLASAKDILKTFIGKREQDRFGLVGYSGVAKTFSPLTLDREVLEEELKNMNTDSVPVEGTAIGDALLVATNRLLGSGQGQPAKATSRFSKKGDRVIVLATDGNNNRGVDPRAAARVIASKGIKLYTIGLGGPQPVLRYTQSEDGQHIPLRDVYGQRQYWDKPDEAMLQQIAEIGGGRYFRATHRAGFEQVMEEIDRLERHKVKLHRFTTVQEEYVSVLLVALLFMVTESLLTLVRFRSLA